MVVDYGAVVVVVAFDILLANGDGPCHVIPPFTSVFGLCLLIRTFPLARTVHVWGLNIQCRHTCACCVTAFIRITFFFDHFCIASPSYICPEHVCCVSLRSISAWSPPCIASDLFSYVWNLLGFVFSMLCIQDEMHDAIFTPYTYIALHPPSVS